MTVYKIKRKCDGKCLKGRKWVEWTDNPNKARLFTQAGHAKSSLRYQVSYTEWQRWEQDYEIVPCEIKE